MLRNPKHGVIQIGTLINRHRLEVGTEERRRCRSDTTVTELTRSIIYHQIKILVQTGEALCIVIVICWPKKR